MSIKPYNILSYEEVQSTCWCCGVGALYASNLPLQLLHSTVQRRSTLKVAEDRHKDAFDVTRLELLSSILGPHSS